MVLLSGRLSIREDEDPKLLVENVDDLKQALALLPVLNKDPVREEPELPPEDLHAAEEARKSPVRIYLHLTESQAGRLENALAGLPRGGIPVYVQMRETHTLRLCSREFWQQDAQLARDKLILAYGGANVKIKGSA